MKDMAELVAQHLDEHRDSHTLETTGGASTTGTHEHQTHEDDPRHVGPVAGIVVAQSGGGHK